MDIATLLQYGRHELVIHGVEDAARDAELLLCHCLSMSRSSLYLHASRPVRDDLCEVYFTLVRRRAAREPYAYIVAEKEFFSLPFFVDRRVLIPRPETEFMLEMVLETVRKKKMVIDRCIDLCCGSGVIAVVLARELHADVIAVDVSEDAITVTQKNSDWHGVAGMIHTRLSDLYADVEKMRCPLIVSNPPLCKTK